MKPQRIIKKDFFIGNLGNNNVPDEILQSYYSTIKSEDVKSLVDMDANVGNMGVDHKVRKCKLSWIDSKESNAIETGLRKIIQNVNNIIWKMNLENVWETNIQFTKYIGKGDHYNWHKDYYENAKDLIFLRKISIVYCLSKKTDYNGGEFQIKTSDGGVYTTKFDYGDFIVFPSDRVHRVKPLKDGERITMVGWYR